MTAPALLSEKPHQSLAGLMNISLGFFGIQIGFALQNANMSRIFQTLGSSIDDLSALWVAAPLTGLLVQPIIGHYSDKTWTRLGRRRPFFLVGALLAALALFIMPLAPQMGWLMTPLIFAAMMLWVLDASINVAMEPFRAFVGDMLRSDQHTAGYAVQTAFIGAGAVVGSVFPYLLNHLGVANTATDGGIPDTVKWSFWFGAAALLAAVLWTIVTTREYSPEQMAAFDSSHDHGVPSIRALASRSSLSALLWIGAGAIVAALVAPLGLQKEVYLLGGLLAAYGLASLAAINMAKAGRGENLLGHIVGDFAGMPRVMKRLAVAQFFSWSALFIMWINTTPVVAQYFYGSADPKSPAYNDGAEWVGILFAIYNGVAAIAALAILPKLAASIGKAWTHMFCLIAGALGFLSFFLIRDPKMLWIAEIGVGIAWASILAMPYAILASALPQQKLGIYMGLFNIFIVVPQLLVATVMGSIMKAFFPAEPIWTMAFAAGSMLCAAAAMLFVARSEATSMVSRRDAE